MELTKNKSTFIDLEEMQLCDVLVMSDTMVSVNDIGDEEGERIPLQELKDNVCTHWKKGNLAVLSTYDYDDGYLRFSIYTKKGKYTDELIFEDLNNNDIYSTLDQYFDMDKYMELIQQRRHQNLKNN